MTDRTYEVLHETLNALYGEENPSQKDICAYVASYATKVMDTVGVDRHYEAQPNTFLKLEGTDFIGYSIFANIEWDGEALVIPYVELVEKVAAPAPSRKQIEVVVGDKPIGVVTGFEPANRELAPAYEINRRPFAGLPGVTPVQPVLGPRGDRGVAGTILVTGQTDTTVSGEVQTDSGPRNFTYSDEEGLSLTSLMQQANERTEDVEFPPSPMPENLANLNGREYVPELDPYLDKRAVTQERETMPIYRLGYTDPMNISRGRLYTLVDGVQVTAQTQMRTLELMRANQAGGPAAIRSARRNWNARNDQAQQEITNGIY